MSSDLINPENVTSEMLKSIFEDACMETEIDADGDVRVREGSLSCFILPGNNNDFLRLQCSFRREDSASMNDLIIFANNVNSQYIIVRASVSDNGVVRFDHYISIRGGLTRKALVYATKRFLNIPLQAIKEHGNHLIQ